MVNTEVTLKYDLISDHNVSHLLKTIPQISTCLLLAMVWSLSLDEYFYECISYTPIWFSFGFIEHLVDSLKYADPYETLDRVDNLIRSIYINIARSEYRAMDIVEKRIIFNRCYDVTMELLGHFYTPDVETFENWPKKKCYKYIGYLVKHNLEMILYCLDVFLNKPKSNDKRIHKAFELMREREPIIEENRLHYTDTTQGILNRLNITLFNILQNNVMRIDCNTFMYWVEVDLDDETTMQRSIGEAAYTLLHLFNVNENFEHDVSDMLRNISIKPLTTEERIAQCTIGELITKLYKMHRNDLELNLWLNGFLRCGELVFGNTECLETIEMHCCSLTIDNVRTMIEFAANVDTNESSIEEKLIAICIGALDNFNENDILNLIQYSIELKPCESFESINYLQLDNFDQQLIETFNKITFSQNSRSYFKLLLQNPLLFYDKVLDEALTIDKQMIEMIELMRITARIYKIYFTKHIDLLINEKLNETNRQHLSKLIAQMFTLHIDDSNEFIINKLYKKYLVESLQIKNINKILLIIDSMHCIAYNYDYNGICPPILVMCAQILELCRWNVTNFTEIAVTTIVKCQEFINEIMKKFLPNANDDDRNWIQTKIDNYDALTKFYFQKLSLTKEQSIQHFDEFLLHGKSIDGSKAFKFLCEHVMRCTTKEIKWLANNEELLNAFWESLNAIAVIVKRANDKFTTDCYRYCCNSVLAVVEVR